MMDSRGISSATGLAAGLIAVALCAANAVQNDTAKLKRPSTSHAKANRSAEIIFFLAPGTSIHEIEARYGVVHKQTLKSDPDAHIFAAGDAVQALSARQSSLQDARVRRVYENRRTHKVKHAFVPNDPYFHKETPAGWFGRGQWHLTNEYTDVDSNVSGTWLQDITGQGVTIGIVDDSFETAHPDLAPNYSAPDSWDFGQNDANPNPVWGDDQHGISVAGVAGARGGNSIGVVGAAPFATLSGQRIDFPNQTVAMFVDATLYRSSGPVTNIDVKNHSYGGSGSYGAAVAESDALTTSTAAGTMHVFSAGNDRGSLYDPDANKKEPQNNPASITVAALGFDGRFSEYSCYGANVVVTAPSSDANAFDDILTTDRSAGLGYNPSSGDSFPDLAYTTLFGGTSSAAPLMAGILALAKQAQPQLNTRFAKHILARSCRMIDPSDATVESDGGWRTNAAGFSFNQNYGFGLVDATKFVNTAIQYSGVTPLTLETTGTTVVALAIPDNSTVGITQTFNLSSNQPLEELLVTIDVTHMWNNDIQVYVASPDGYTNRLAKQAFGYIGGTNGFVWTYCTHAFWGCNPQGTWTLNVSDRAGVDTGTWNAFSVTARMGELIVAPPIFLDVSVPSAGNTILQWSSFTNEQYSLGYASNLIDGFAIISSNIVATPVVNIYTDAVHNAEQQFWQVTVEP